MIIVVISAYVTMLAVIYVSQAQQAVNQHTDGETLVNGGRSM